MGIVFSNFIRNAGNMPKIQATTDYTTITGQQNSIALDTSSNTLYYWDPNSPEWIGLTGGGTPNLQNVLNTGNTAFGVGIDITGQNIVINTASLLVRDTTLGAIVVNAAGILFGDYDLTANRYVLEMVSNNPVQSITNSVGGTMELSPGANTGIIAVNYPKTSGNIYCIELVEATLINGVATFNPGGESNLILGVGVKVSSGTMGVTYQWSGIGGSGAITITSLKTSGGIETSDNSTLYVTIAL